MFYSTDLLSRTDGKFAAIWLASVYGKNIKKKLTRRQITAVNIPQACTDVLHPHVKLSLRLQSNLMVGILRVYYEQVSHFCEITKRAWRDLRMTFNVDMRLIDLQNNVLSEKACTLPDPLMDGRHFSILSSHRFSMDDYEEFIRADFHSPASSTISSSPLTPIQPHMLQSPWELITMPDSTLPDITDKPIEVPGDQDLTPEIVPTHDEQTVDIESPLVREDQPPEESEVQIIDPTSGELRTEDTSELGKRQRVEMVTPSGQPIEPTAPERPRKRRRGQPVDIIRKLSDEKMKRNHLNVSKTLREKIIDLPLRLTADELMNNPSRPELRRAPFFKLWQQNTIPQPIPDDEVPDFFSSFDESDMSPEVVRESGVHVSGYDQSGSHLITPTPETESPTPTQRKIVADFPDIARPSPDFPTIDEVTIEGDTVPTISPIVETPEEEGDESYEQELQSHLAQVMGERDETSFSEVFPVSKTRKGTAAKGLFQLLEWHRRNVVVLSQLGASFNEISIKRGPNF